MPDEDPARRRVFDPPRAVVVERDGEWWPGRQTAWVRWEPDGPWRASVRYTTGPGSVYAHDVPGERVRPRPE